MNIEDRYLKVLEVICAYYGMNRSDLVNLLKERDNKYLLLLLLKKYRCMDEKKIKEIFNLSSSRSISYNIKRAEEKLLINREFREIFFQIEEDLLK